MTFGRPAMVSRASSGAVPLPLTIDDELITTEPSQEPAQLARDPCMMTFYAKTLELYEIMNDVLLSLYNPVPEDSPTGAHGFLFSGTSEGERTIFDLDRSLTRWNHDLPPHLHRNPEIESENHVFYRQGIVLRARYATPFSQIEHS